MLCLSGFELYSRLVPKFGSVRTDYKGKKPQFRFRFRLFHTSSPLRSIELSVKTLNVISHLDFCT